MIREFGGSMNRFLALALFALLLALGGCRRGVKSEKTYDLTPNKLAAVDLPAARRLQVDFATKDKTPVTAILVSKEDADAALDTVASKGDIEAALKVVSKQIAMQINRDMGTLNSPNTNTPTRYSVLFTTKKATSVTVKSSGE